MFTKKDTPPAPEAGAAPAATKRSAMKSQAPSILSADLTITGSIASEGEIQLDGSVDGDIRAGSLTVGEEASVNGEVIAENVVVRGRVVGSIRARQVQLASTARIEGDIIHATLAIESGAYFDGYCRRSSDPMSDKGDSDKSKGSAKPAAAAASTTPPPSSGSTSSGSSASGSTAFGSSSTGTAAARSGDTLGVKS